MGPYGVPGSLSMGPYGVPGSRDSWTRGLWTRDLGSRDSGTRNRRLTRDSHFRPKIFFFLVKLQFLIVNIFKKKIRDFRTCSSRKNPEKIKFQKKMLEKFILIYFQPFQMQIKVSTKFHNF